ncbi:hypothetical protein HAX54_024413 [Datura stramonium]|uniref:Uncharacterized protein n=1 Tax=Datura stramonium TaxID=4076 RepID=A0ABS8UY67_DATST|nr:hypothetical protein [Datura stramonium]
MDDYIKTRFHHGGAFIKNGATNVGDINTDHEVEKDLGETENLEDINLEVDEEFGETSDKVDVDVDIVDETEQYVEEHLDGVETDVESSSDSEKEGIPEEDDSEVDEELRSAGINRGFEDIGRNKVARYTRRLGGDEDYIDSLEADNDDNKDELDPKVVVGVDLPGRRKSTKSRYDNECGVYIFELGMIFESVKEFKEVVTNGVGKGKRVSGQKRGPINTIGRAQKRSNNVGFGLYHDNRTETQVLNLGTSERVVIVGSNIIYTARTNIDIGFKPPGLRWMGRETISTSQLQQMRNSRSGNL